MVRTLYPFSALAIACAIAGPAIAQHPEVEPVRHIDSAQLGPYRPAKRPDLAKVAEQIVEQTNRFRKDNGSEPVRVDEHLQQAAQEFAGYMARTDDYGHTADGKQPADRAKAHDYKACIVSENIAYQFSTIGFRTDPLADVFVKGWKESPPHRKNMLDPDVDHTGVAVALSKKTGVFYAVQMFGRPESNTVEFKVANRTGAPVKYRVGEQTFELPTGYVQMHQLCRPAELALPVAAGAAKSDVQKFRPQTGDSFAIEMSAEGTLQLSRAAK